MYSRRNSRFRYALHTLIHDPKPITTDPMTMYLRWRRSWYDLDRSRYAHADQLTFCVRSNQRYLSRPYQYICADHCRSLVLAYHYHGSSIRCSVFGSYFETACHSRATDCSGTIPMEERPQLNWSHWQQNRSNRSLAEQIKKDRIVSRTVWSVLSRIGRTEREWMYGWNRYILNGAPLILRGLRPCQSPRLTFDEP